MVDQSVDSCLHGLVGHRLEEPFPKGDGLVVIFGRRRRALGALVVGQLVRKTLKQVFRIFSAKGGLPRIPNG